MTMHEGRRFFRIFQFLPEAWQKYLKKLYHGSQKRVNSFLLHLCKTNHFWLTIPLSAVARRFFLREFSSRKRNYDSKEELITLITNAHTDLAVSSADYSEQANAHQGVKVLMVFSKYANSAYAHGYSDRVETNFDDAWCETARELGFDVQTFHADKISYVPASASSSETANREGKELLNQVRKFRPDLVFMDINYLGNSNTINQELISEIRAVHNCKIAGHIGDYNSKEAIATAKYWSRSLDIVLQSEPAMSTDNIPNVNYVHYFANERSFYPASEKRYDLTFSGSGNISRYVYLAAAKSISRKRGYQCQINVHSHDILSALSAGDYARMVRESRAVLVLSARAAPGVRVVTGRVQQTIASKALLIAEHCDSMNRLFTPYVHFIPFDSQKELAIAMEFSVTSQDLVGAITEAAYKKYRQEHSSAVVWARILDLCGIHNTELKSIQS